MRDTLCSVCFAMIKFVHSLPGVSRSLIIFVIVSVYFHTVRDFTQKKIKTLPNCADRAFTTNSFLLIKSSFTVKFKFRIRAKHTLQLENANISYG